MPSKKDYERLDAIKANKLKVGKGLPAKYEGENGDLQVRRTTKGLVLFAKLYDKWYRVSKLEDIHRDGGKHIGTPEDKTFGKMKAIRHITTPAIKDTQGNVAMEIKKMAAVGTVGDRFTLAQATGLGTAALSMDGDGANIPLKLQTKGTGNLLLTCAADGGVVQILEDNAIYFQFDPSASARREFRMNGNAYNIGLIDTDTDGQVRLWNFDGLSGETAAHIKISASDDLYLAAGGGQIRLSSGGTGQNGVTFDTGTEFGQLAGGGGSFITHTATATTTGFKVDSNLSGDSASSGTGLHIDFDRTVPGSGTASHTDIGIDLDVSSASLGSTTARGMDIDVAGATSGSSTTIGVDIVASGADANIGLLINTPGTHIHMQAAADAVNDYGTIAVADTGDMTITTVGNGTTDSDLFLDIDGDLYIDVDGGEARITDDGGTYTPNHATSIATKAYVDEKRFATTSTGLAARMSSVNTWYISNQSFGTGIAGIDWSTTKFNYSVYNSTTAVKLKSWRVVGEISSSVDYEWELWDIAIPADGTAAVSVAAKVGDTQSVSPTAYRIYTIGQTDLDYGVAEGRSLYVLRRYTSGSGTKYTYETVTLEFEVG